MATKARNIGVPEHVKRQSLKRRRDQWDPSAKTGGIYEDVNASTQSDVGVKSRMNGVEMPVIKESNVGNPLRKSRSNKRSTGCPEYRERVADARTRLRKAGIGKPEERTQDQYLVENMIIAHGTVAYNFEKENTKMQRQVKESVDQANIKEVKRDHPEYSLLKARRFENSFLGGKEVAIEIVPNKENAKVVSSRSSASHIRKAAAQKRILKQSSSDKYQLNLDVGRDRPGQNTGKENVPPGIGEGSPEKLETLTKTTVTKRTAPSALMYSHKPSQQQSIGMNEYVGIRINKTMPELTDKAPTQLSKDKGKGGAKNDSLSAVRLHRVWCDNPISAKLNVEEAEKSSEHIVGSLTSKRRSSPCKSFSPSLSPSCVRSNFQPVQGTGLYSTASQHISKENGPIDNILFRYGQEIEEMIYSTRLYKNTRFLIFSKKSHGTKQHLYVQNRIESNKELQQIPSLAKRSVRSQLCHIRYESLQDDIDYDTRLSLSKLIYRHSTPSKADLPLDFARSMQLSYFSTQPQSRSLNNKIAHTEIISRGHLNFSSMTLPTEHIKITNAARELNVLHRFASLLSIRTLFYIRHPHDIILAKCYLRSMIIVLSNFARLMCIIMYFNIRQSILCLDQYSVYGVEHGIN